MVSMSKKMYKNSPKVERDEEDGKVKIKKSSPAAAEKESAEVNDGTSGIETHESHLKDMLDRHQAEMKTMGEGHMDQLKKFHEKYLAKEEESEGEDKPEGKKEIKKIEKTEKGKE